MRGSYDAVIVGSGPNGLAAGIRLAQEGLSVLLIERAPSIGGGTRSAELTLPGFTHDVCSAVHPLAVASPFFRQLPLQRFGLRWIQPSFPVAHPLDGGRAGVIERSLEATVARLGPDGVAYQQLFAPIVRDWDRLVPELLRPILRLPRSISPLIRFGWRGLASTRGLVNARFTTEVAQALFAGIAAHSFLSFDQMPSAIFGLILAAAAHTGGWPIPCGGSQAIALALESYFRSLGGEIVTGHPVMDLSELPKARAVLLDVGPRQLLSLCGPRLPARYRRALAGFRQGPGVFKIDYALSGPIPWTAGECRQAGTVHVGGTFEEIAAAEREVAGGKAPERPFVLVAQPSLFDRSRAPQGQHTAWAYCHVPNGSTEDMTERMEAQLERFAPGFPDCILARHTMSCADLERRNPNLAGGDISGGANDLWQLVKRPILSPTPYRVPLRGYYLCSSSTPPGGGTHGMCGFHAAESAIQDWFR